MSTEDDGGIYLDLSVARTGQGERFDITAKTLRVVDASDISAEASVSLRQNGQTHYYKLIDQAFIRDSDGFSGFYIKNTAQAGKWLRLVPSNEKEDFEYEKPTSNSISEITEPVMTRGGASSNTAAVTVGVAASAILAANADRTGWTIHNASTATIYIGGAGVTTATGLPVVAGEKYGEDGRDAVYAISGSAGCDVRVREVTA